MNSSMYKENSDTYKLPAGTTEMKDWRVDDIRLVYTKTRYNHLAAQDFSNDTDLVRLHFSLKGDYDFYYKQLNESFHLSPGHHNIMYSSGFDMTVTSHELDLETFGIQFSRKAFIELTHDTSDILNRFGEDVLTGKDTILSKEWQSMTPQLYGIVDDILNCQFSGGLKRLFLLSKSIELLVQQAESYASIQSRNRPTFIKHKDRDRLHDARQFVLSRLKAPPTLEEVAKEVGINQYKLKKGFKELFGKTVYGFLTDQRLAHGRQLLLDTDQTASEVAFELGYSSLPHFSTAFKKRYGVSPSDVKH